MKDVTQDNVRDFLLTRYSEPIKGMRVNLAELPDDFDLFLAGVLEMISAIEHEFQIQLDLGLLDAEDITRIGPLARYTAENAKR